MIPTGDVLVEERLQQASDATPHLLCCQRRRVVRGTRVHRHDLSDILANLQTMKVENGEVCTSGKRNQDREKRACTKRRLQVWVRSGGRDALIAGRVNAKTHTRSTISAIARTFGASSSSSRDDVTDEQSVKASLGARLLRDDARESAGGCGAPIDGKSDDADADGWRCEL
jgi:hypothetical protein